MGAKPVYLSPVCDVYLNCRHVDGNQWGPLVIHKWTAVIEMKNSASADSTCHYSSIAGLLTPALFVMVTATTGRLVATSTAAVMTAALLSKL